MEDKVIELINADIYQNENLVLSEVNLEVGKGEFIYVVGKININLDETTITYTEGWVIHVLGYEVYKNVSEVDEVVSHN